MDLLRPSSETQSVTKLIRIRSKAKFPLGPELEDVRADPLYLGLPVFKSQGIAKMNDALNRGASVKDALKIIDYPSHYNLTFVQSLFAACRERKKVTVAEQLAFLYECLALIVHGFDADFAKTTDIFMTILNSTCDSPFCGVYGDIVHEFVEILLESDSLKMADVSLLFMHFLVNRVLNESSSQDLVRICLDLSNNDPDRLQENMAVISLLFQQDSPAIHVTDYRLFLSCFAKSFTQLNEHALLTYAHASRKTSDSIISSSFALIPSILFAWIVRNRHETNDERIFANSREFIMPKEGDFREACHIDLVNLASEIVMVLRCASPNIVTVFLEALVEFELNNNDLQHALDFYKVVILVLSAICAKTDVSFVVLMFTRSIVFNEKETVFSDRGLLKELNSVRHGIFDVIERTGFSIFDRFLSAISAWSFITAESVLRAMYMFGRDILLTHGSAESVLIAINGLKHDTQNPEARTRSRAVLLSTLVSILNDNQTAIECFSNDSFSTGFLNLVFDSECTQIVSDSFANVLSHFDTLPPSIMAFLTSILSVCASPHAIEGDFASLALCLMKGVLRGLLHNPRISVHFGGFFEKILPFVKSTKSKEWFEVASSMLTLVVQGTKKVEITDDEFSTIMEIIASTYGDEPSSDFLRSWLSVLSASTSVNTGANFSIEVPTVISVIVCAYAQSRKLGYVLSLFQQLCDYSQNNVLACHQGYLDLILLKALGGAFVFRDRKMRFSMREEEIDMALKLVSTIVSDVTSVDVDQIILDLLMHGTNLEVNNKLLNTLYELFCVSENQYKNEIWSPEPIYTIEGVSGQQLTNGFGFSFFLRVGSTVSINDVFTIMRTKDCENKVLELVYFHGSLILRHRRIHGQVSAVAAAIPPNRWIWVTCFLAPFGDSSIVCYRFGNEYGSEIQFAKVLLEGEVCFEIGTTDHTVIGAGRVSPVSIGRFALFFPPYQVEDFDEMFSNRMTEIPKHLNVCFTWNTPNCKKNVTACKEDSSIISVMPRHLRMSDLTKLFANKSCLECPTFTEMLLKTFIRCADFVNACTSGRAHVSLVHDDTSNVPFLTERIGIPVGVFKEFNSSSSQYRFFMHLSEISEIVSRILHTSSGCINACLFSSFIEMLNATNDEELVLELLENVILNVWVWATDDVHQHNKIVTQIRNTIGICKIPSNSKLFEQFLVQTHMLLRYSEKNFSKLQSDMFKILEMLPVSFEELPSLIAVMRSITDNEIVTKFLDLLYRKDCELSSSFLIILTDFASRNCSQVTSKLVQLVQASLKERPLCVRQCFCEMALCGSLETGLANGFELGCINALKGVITSDDLLKISKQNNFINAPFSFIWPTLVAVYLDKRMIQVLAEALTTCDRDHFLNVYVSVLNFLDVVRSTGKFAGIGDIVHDFVCSVLDYVISQVQLFSQKSLREIIYRTFMVCYYRLKSSSHTQALLEAWAGSPFNEEGVSFSQQKPREPQMFSVDGLKAVIYAPLDGLRFVYRKSRKNSEILSRVVSLIDRSSRLEHDELCRMIRECSSGTANVHVSNQVFQHFSSDGGIQNGTFSALMSEVQSFIDPKSKCPFDDKRILADVYNAERIRLKRIYSYVDREELTARLFSPRFLQFPFSIVKKLHWNIDENDEFRRVRQEPTVETVTILSAFPCKILSIVEKANGTFTILSKEIRISQIGKAVKSIRFERIGLISTIRRKHIEIFTDGSCESVLLSFSDTQYQRVLAKLRELNLEMITTREEGLQILFNFWTSGRISKFQLLVGVNLVSGRSFADIYSYPIAPVIYKGRFMSTNTPVDNGKYVSALTRWFFALNMIRSDSLPVQSIREDDEIARAVSDCECVPPQLYYSFYSFDPKVHDLIYETRKLMDQDNEIGKPLIQWIETQFDVRIPPQTLEPKFNEKHSDLSLSPPGNLIQCQFFKLAIDAFFVQWEDNTVAVLYFNSSGGSSVLMTLRKFKEKLILSNNVLFCPLNSVMLIFDLDNQIVYRIGDSVASQKMLLSLSITHVCEMGDDVVFVIDAQMIETCPAMSFPVKRRTIATETRRITAIQASAVYNIVVYSTSDGWLEIITAENAAKIGRLYVGSPVRKILITKLWGFIIIETDSHLITSTIDGVVRNRVPLPAPVSEWCVHTHSSVEYLICRISSEDHTSILAFEAFSLTRPIELCRIACSTISMRISGERNKLYLISKPGRVRVLPLCL